MRTVAKAAAVGFFLLLIWDGLAHATNYTYSENTSFTGPNPERGFYSKNGTGFTTSNNITTHANTMYGSRTGSVNGVSPGNVSLYYDRYDVGCSGLSGSEITNLQTNLGRLRDTGMKAIFRAKTSSTSCTITQVRNMLTQLGNATEDYCDVIAFFEVGHVGDFGEWHGQTSAGDTCSGGTCTLGGDSCSNNGDCTDCRTSENCVCEADGSTYWPRDAVGDPCRTNWTSANCECFSACQTGTCTNTVGTVTCSTNTDCIGADTQSVYEHAMDVICPTGDTQRMVGFRNPRWEFIPRYQNQTSQPYDGSTLSRMFMYNDGLFTGKYDGAGTLNCSEYPGSKDYIVEMTEFTFTSGESSQFNNGTCTQDSCIDSNGRDCDPQASATCSSGFGTCVDYRAPAQSLPHADEFHLAAYNDGFSVNGGACTWDNAASGGSGGFTSSCETLHVLNNSTSGGENALTRFKKRIGYRYVLTQATLPTASVATGTTMPVSFAVRNDGYANLYNPRTAYITLRRQGTSSENSTNRANLPLNSNPRRWDQGATTVVTEGVVIPSTLTAGTYDVAVWLPDISSKLRSPNISLANQVKYSIRFANSTSNTGTEVWDATRGYNVLGTVTITTGPGCTSNGQCDDGNTCTTDTCQSGSCNNANNTAACDDLIYCNGTDTCAAGGCNTHAGSPCSGSTPVCVEGSDSCEAASSDEVEQWHTFRLDFTDNEETYTEAQTTPNPHYDRRLVTVMTSPAAVCSSNDDCHGAGTCSSTQCSYQVEGFWDADGDPGTTHATSGNIFSVRFSPPYIGNWTWVARFCEGTDAALSTAAECSTGGFTNDALGLAECTTLPCTGGFSVVPSTATGRDFRSPTKGWLTNNSGFNSGEGAHYLSFAGGTPGWWMKLGMGTGEGFLGYEGFDNTDLTCTPGYACVQTKTYANHTQHWDSGDPTFECSGCSLNDDGRGIIGLINYLAEPAAGVNGVNSKYVMMNSSPDGDTCAAHPFVTGTNTAQTRRHFDVSKLAQWNIVFEHMTKKGILLNALLGESENDEDMQDTATSCTGSTTNCIGSARKIYFRELQARFGHNPAIEWTLDEENGFTNPARASYLQWIKAVDPYDHPTSVHTQNSAAGVDEIYEDTESGVALHHASGSRAAWDDDLDMTSIQIAPTKGTYDIYDECFGGTSSLGVRAGWRTQSDSDAMRWICSIDEPQACVYSEASGSSTSMQSCRTGLIWPGLLGGLGGYEQYHKQSGTGSVGHGFDPCVNDFSLVESTIRWLGIADTVFNNGTDLGGLTYSESETYVTDGASTNVYQAAVAGTKYLAYSPANASLTLTNLTSGTYSVNWVNPASGQVCACDSGSCSSGQVTGDGTADPSVGDCPCCTVDALLIVDIDEPVTTTTTTSSTTTTTTTTTTTSTTTTTIGTACSATHPTCGGDCGVGTICTLIGPQCLCVENDPPQDTYWRCEACTLEGGRTP